MPLRIEPRAPGRAHFQYRECTTTIRLCLQSGATGLVDFSRFGRGIRKRLWKSYTYQPTESSSKSNYPNDKFEVIAQKDRSVDDSYEWMRMLKAQREFTNIPVRVGRNTRDGIQHADPYRMTEAYPQVSRNKSE